MGRVFSLSVMGMVLAAVAACAPPAPTVAPSPVSATPVARLPAPTTAPLSWPTSPAPTLAPTASPTARAESETPAPAAPLAIALRKVADGFVRPLHVTHGGDGSGRLYVVEQEGRVRVIENGVLRAAPFIDVRDRVSTAGNERGLLSIAFPPDFAASSAPAVYVNYTGKSGATVVSRFPVDRARGSADPSREAVLLTIPQPYANHNGGLVTFGPDGMLYVGMGDGGSAGDPQNLAQNPESLLGKMLRIDVRSAGGSKPYAIPPGNPPIEGREPTEIWAIGLRNPWRFSFDRATGDLYIADVGQNAIEEVNFAPAASTGGENYGWRLREGFEPYRGGADSARFTAPAHQYTHAEGCSITGGFVYRGRALPGLAGAYVYGDYCSGRVWALRRSASGAWQNTVLLEAGVRISSFGDDEAGELYLVDHGGAVFKLVAQ